MKPQDRILQQLKTKGPQTAVELGKTLKITSMGARGHLERMAEQGLVDSKEVRSGVGRPRKTWHLTDLAQSHFPDRHDQLTSDIIVSVREVFGEQGLDQLIQHREQTTEKLYQGALARCLTLEDKLAALVDIRSREGYMASYEAKDNGFLFVENHCPVSAAVRACQGFCRAELKVFQNLFANIAHVKRTEYILEGDRRCAYTIKPKLSSDDK